MVGGGGGAQAHARYLDLTVGPIAYEALSDQLDVTNSCIIEAMQHAVELTLQSAAYAKLCKSLRPKGHVSGSSRSGNRAKPSC